MLIALWITAVLLTIAYLGAGGVKLARRREQLQPMMSWVEKATNWQVKLVGLVEVIGALGVILPLATGIAPVLTAIAALGLALVQVAAIVIHTRLGDIAKQWPVNAILLLLAVAVAVLRFATL